MNITKIASLACFWIGVGLIMASMMLFTVQTNLCSDRAYRKGIGDAENVVITKIRESLAKTGSVIFVDTTSGKSQEIELMPKSNIDP